MQNRKITKMVENYSLDEVIGSGQYGKVYRATNIKTNKVVAIKVVKIQKFKENPKLEECTVNEIKTLSQMDDNRHVVSFIELLRSSNNYYFVYEFCSGGTLEDQLKKKKIFKENEALHVFAQLLEAFKVLRKFNIMHRDLKPTNILLHNNQIKLADFGFCKSLTNPTDMAQTMLGSPLYMAPEILRGQDYCVKADIWSLGVVLYELLFGICPFEEKSIVRLISLLNDGQLVIRKDIQNISPQTEALLMAMLVKDPEQRISWDQLFQIQINSDGEYVDPNAQIKGGAQNLSSKKERSQQPKPPHSTPQQFQNAASSQEEIQKQNSTNSSNNMFPQHQNLNSQTKPQSSIQPTHFNPNHQRSVSSHAMFTQHSKTETPSKTAFANGGGMTRDYSNDKIGLTQNNMQATEKKSNESKDKINSVQQFQQVLETNANNLVGFNTNEINRPNSQNSVNSFVPHPPQRENPFRSATTEDKIAQQNFKAQDQLDSPLAPQRLQLDQTSNSSQAQQMKDPQNSIKFQRQDHKRALTSIGGVANYQKPLSINNNIMNIQQNEHIENNADYLNLNPAAAANNSATSSQTNLASNLYSNSDSKRNILHGQTLEDRYKQPILQTQKPPTLVVTPTLTLQTQPTSQIIQKDPQVSQDLVSTLQSSSSTSGRSINNTSCNQNNANIALNNNSASASGNSQALNLQVQSSANNNPSNLQNSSSSSKIASNNQLSISGNNQISMYSSTGNQIPPIHPSIASAGVCKNNKQQNVDISQKIVQELSKERNKLFFLTQLLYELIDICENENYNIILPQITYQYYQQIILTRCERLKKLIELNQSFISQQIDLPAPLTTMDLARTMMNEGYIKIRSAIEKEITLIEQNFLHVKNEYLYFEIYFQQNNNNEQFQSMKSQNIEQLIKSFIKQVIANNDSDEGGETSYINRLRVCAKLVDVYDFDNILINELGNNVNNWAYNKEIKNADKQKILSKIFNHQSLSPIN
ncbi:Serine/Threonine kinase domain protein (macronuclear) [Tetrahymena thermophila SB210]|uniref:Serine/Threonine kinase domain protein n=1 Tax=Tetrahymena thermophila (strain SB210) TaxID=312017 RepID=A4VDU3_TETTS|nr:Serine/Threonine kinase domain protein [Tetrahymena thermophila SB210]EDK31682.2 Serine/Threonine kinase domain protein [Tetrahymena thermophila SB210]|eukprot:XP_001470810.2 Serine/Threonine kinase domain protein [Tetrahymena thermophila SB210]